MSWELPRQASLAGKTYPHRSDFREILKLLSLLGDESKPEFLRWQAGLYYFYHQEVPQAAAYEAMAYMESFLTAGERCAPGPRLYDWKADAQLIAGEVNAVAGCEVRQLEYLHWWTFLGYFRSIGEGQFSLVVGIRDKLRRGAKLEPHEESYYRQHRAQVRLKSPDSPEKQRLEALLAKASEREGPLV